MTIKSSALAASQQKPYLISIEARRLAKPALMDRTRPCGMKPLE